MSPKPRIFSGIQPSGNLHIGNYFGAIQQWVEMQNQYESIFCIVDEHAITVRQDPKILKQKIQELAAVYLAAAIDPKKSIIFVQSHIPAHTECGWILNCYTQIGDLERMTQYKDKAKQHKKNINNGLFSYPVLMAADILLYDTDIVPVGDDQVQHVELTRKIGRKFNNIYGDIFKIPQVKIQKAGARIMGLDNPESKMSKSATNENNRISLIDEPEIIKKKINKAVTDSKEKVGTKNFSPGVENLLNIYELSTGKTREEIIKDVSEMNYGNFKQSVADALIEKLNPIRTKIKDLLDNPKGLEKILEDGATKADEIANKKLKTIKTAIGLG